MWSVMRNVLAVIVGFVAATAVMMVVESINGQVLYPELGKKAAGVTDIAVIKEIMASAPVGALLVVLIGWVIGSIAGAFLAILISRSKTYMPAIVLGVLLTLAGVANNLMLPPPVWFWIATFAAFLPSTFVGARLAGAGKKQVA
jgi:hypothetical protein